MPKLKEDQRNGDPSLVGIGFGEVPHPHHVFLAYLDTVLGSTLEACHQVVTVGESRPGRFPQHVQTVTASVATKNFLKFRFDILGNLFPELLQMCADLGQQCGADGLERRTRRGRQHVLDQPVTEQSRLERACSHVTEQQPRISVDLIHSGHIGKERNMLRRDVLMNYRSGIIQCDHVGEITRPRKKSADTSECESLLDQIEHCTQAACRDPDSDLRVRRMIRALR
ncbi:hypothetical protein ACGFYV_17450 [Streptomyces sp. NPDC048297]|uniref:hypothetical protein n=1 Tax=Streptomyces sp. NPDC048297 TaxID=3365531 RepID=UPI00371B3B74